MADINYDIYSDPNAQRITTSDLQKKSNHRVGSRINFKKLISWLFRIYCKIGYVIFGSIFMVNLIKGVHNPTRGIFNPFVFIKMFFIMLIGKSTLFGLFWPLVPQMLTNQLGRDELSIIGI
jgi:hypothetical protein